MNSKFVKECIRVFAFAFIPVFVAGLTGISSAPDLSTAKAAVFAAALAAVGVAIKATLDFLTKGVAPAPNVGVLPPSVKE